MITFQDVFFSYPIGKQERLPALRGLSGEIRKGEFLAVLGPNGSGKSTFAKLLNALLVPESGEVHVFGWDTRDSSHLWDIRQAVGMVFQNPENQLVASTIEEDVAFGPENLGLPPKEIQARVEEALRKTGLSGQRRTDIHALSGGEKQLVAIAGVLAMLPSFIIFDEATTMLDSENRAIVLDAVRKLREDHGIGVVLITHRMEEAVLADRILVIGNGEILLQGSPLEVFSLGAKVRSLGLDLPPMLQLAELLRKEGVSLSGTPLTVSEMEGALQL
ncbi:MAG: energy-coupling factor transporter ATPase [Armatimonadetes bacterium]|nr:energy-coupling factor transporter ATPase [Armatimonadota bacterium]